MTTPSGNIGSSTTATMIIEGTSGTSKPTLSNAELKEKIGAINATEIEAIGKRIVTYIMERMDIDIIGDKPVEGQFNRDTSGKLHPVIATKYYPKSRFLEMLLPTVTKQITDAFSLSDAFLEDGIKFNVFSSMKNDGIVNAIAKEYREDLIQKGVNRIINNGFQLKELQWTITLKLNQKRTQERYELIFDRHELWNGANAGHMDFSIKDCEESVRHSTV